MRLIDANPLWEFFRDQQNDITKYARYHQLNNEDKAAYDRLEIVLDAIDAAPTISPASLVKRGRWLHEPGRIPRCSACMEYSDDADTGQAICCPFCGALMED